MSEVPGARSAPGEFLGVFIGNTKEIQRKYGARSALGGFQEISELVKINEVPELTK